MHSIQNSKGIKEDQVQMKSLLSPGLQAHRPPAPLLRHCDCGQFLTLPKNPQISDLDGTGYISVTALAIS